MKALRYIFISLSSLVLLMLIGAWILAHFYGEKIQQMAIQRLNEQLQVQVDVKQVDFSLIENFPFASVQFSEVILYSSNVKDDSLLAAQKLYCKFNLLDLYHGKYKLSGIEINDGFCRLNIDQSGKSNYGIWKNNSNTSGKFSLELERIDLRNLDFSYIDDQEEFNLNLHVNKSKIRASLSGSLSEFELESDFNQTSLKIEDLIIFDNRKTKFQASFELNQDQKSLVFGPSKLSIENLELMLTGDYTYGKNTWVDFGIAGENVELANTISLLPRNIQDELLKYDIGGSAKIEGMITGELGGEKSPHVIVNFEVFQGEFVHKESNLSFKKTTLSGKLTNGDGKSMKSSTLRIEDFKTQLNQGYVEGKLNLWDFTKPNYTFSGSLDFLFQDLVSFLKLDDIRNPKGHIKSNLSFSGQVNEQDKYDIRDFKKAGFTGSLSASGFGFSLKNEALNIEELSSQLNFNNNQISIEELGGIINQNEMQLTGELYNLIPYLIADHEKLLIDCELESRLLNFEQLFNSQSEESDTIFSLPKNIHAYIDLNTSRVLVKNIALEEVRSLIELKAGSLSVRDIGFKAFGGELRADLFWDEGKKELQSRSDFNELDLNQLFKGFQNFGQNTIKAENLEGQAFGEVNSSMSFSPLGKLDLSSIKVESNLVLEQGRLKNVKALEALSDYIELEELKDIQFKTLQNQLFVQDCTISIPRFEIQSSALNLSLEGRHYFNNNIDYHFTLLLNELLGKKVRKPKDLEYGYIEDDGLGQTKVFLKMYGNTSQPQFSYDKTELKTHLKAEVKKEKNTIKSLLNKEFGLFKKDTTIQDYKGGQENRKSPFKIDWPEKQDNKKPESQEEKEKKAEKKSRFGKFIDKIAKPNEEEYE